MLLVRVLIICLDIVNYFLWKILCVIYTVVDYDVTSLSSVAGGIVKTVSPELPEFLTIYRLPVFSSVYPVFRILFLL